MNKNRPFLHFSSENDSNYRIFLVLLPLLCYGFYKNGILPFLNHDITGLQMLRPILFPMTGFGIGVLVDYLIWYQNSEKIIWTTSPLYGLLISMTMPIQANLLVIGILLFLLLFCFRKLEKTKVKLNGLLLTKVMLSILLTFVAKVSYQNPTEASRLIVYSTLDIFFGRNIGGISSTSIFWMLIAFSNLWFDYYYKKGITLYMIGTFLIMSLIFELILPTGNFILFILNPSFFFASIFFATESSASPYTELGQLVYGITIGMVAFFFIRFLNQYEGGYLAIMILSLFVPMIDKISYHWEKKNKKFCRKSILKKEDWNKNTFQNEEKQQKKHIFGKKRSSDC